jgi:hypothetical protein
MLTPEKHHARFLSIVCLQDEDEEDELVFEDDAGVDGDDDDAAPVTFAAATASFLGQKWEICPAPEVLSQALIGNTVAFRWENVGWMLGEVVKMNARGGKIKFDVSYPDDAAAIGRHELGLDAYVVGGAVGAETCPVGAWAVVAAKGAAAAAS